MSTDTNHDTISCQPAEQRPYTYTVRDHILWPAFVDTVGVYARCKHCTHHEWGSTFADAGIRMVWHMYDDHRAQWRRQYGVRVPLEARPADLADPTGPDR